MLRNFSGRSSTSGSGKGKLPAELGSALTSPFFYKHDFTCIIYTRNYCLLIGERSNHRAGRSSLPYIPGEQQKTLI